MKFKRQFRHITYYSMPTSILFIFKKRLNFIALMILILAAIPFTLL